MFDIGYQNRKQIALLSTYQNKGDFRNKRYRSVSNTSAIDNYIALI